jgi:hypothetical protein
MDQKIFSLGLSVECVSLYLLCCGIDAAGLPISDNTVKERWNSSAEDLQLSLQTLLARNILDSAVSSAAAGQYRVLPASEWINTKGGQ